MGQQEDAATDQTLAHQNVALHAAVATLFSELMNGTGASPSWILNPNDSGLLGSLDALGAAAASATPGGRPSIAAHVDHLRYGLELLNRASQGENPFTETDYSASWRRLTVTDQEWATLRQRLRDEANRWLTAIRQLRPLSDLELTRMLASVAHLAYHLGAIRQIDRSTRGPSERD